MEAFTAVWKTACEAPGPSTITVPKGPCKGPVTFEMSGNMKAPATVAAVKPNSGWVDFTNLADFTLNGNGAIFDGQGSLAWKANDCAKTGKCNSLPINIRFTGLTNSKIIGITSTNSKLFHMNVLNCKNVTLENIGIDAPPESLNTDGIHIGRSIGVNLIGAKVKTGDDCVSIGDGTENLIVENVECGPGHGIAVGSLGRYPNEQPVRGVTVRKCLIKNTSNGVPSKVKLSDVTFKNIKGTSATKIAVKLICSVGTPCTNVALADINLVHNGPEGPAVGACANMKPVLTGQMIPPACTEIAKPGP
ncbi:hypothetical protein HID58_095021 [Brassica napus]|uniref:Polygalacturonase n=1 Tax=Brassica napus TaxID=3708 RepID=A0ABQ7X555_BRANA|nr:hypothetical protein HID58_095021 [Brassica napus]